MPREWRRTASAGDSVGETKSPALVARGGCHCVRRGPVCDSPLLECDVQRDRCNVGHGLAERFAEHRDQCWAVGQRCALKGHGDDGGGCEAQCDGDCGGQSAFGAGEHAGEMSRFHDVFPFVSFVANLR